jgi:hypothetical protein
MCFTRLGMSFHITLVLYKIVLKKVSIADHIDEKDSMTSISSDLQKV